jgi:hypothetical protein
VLLACFEATEKLAPWVYAALAPAIGIFAARYDWSAGAKAPPELEGFD